MACIAVLLYVYTFAQQNRSSCNITLSGVLSDEDTGLPLQGASLLFKDDGRTAFTDKYGKFQFSSLCSGIYTLQIQLIGYKSVTQKIKVQNNLSLSLALHAENIALTEVEVTGHKKKVNTANNSETIQGKALDLSKGQSLAAIAKDITGVSMLQTGGTIAKPVIHGLHSNRVLILNNGLRQEGQQWGSEHAPEIDPFTAQSVTVVKGSESIRYGADAIGGVLIVEPAHLPLDSHISGEVNTIAMENSRAGIVSATLSGGVKAWKGFAWRVQGSGKKAGNLRTPDYYLNNTGVRELNFSGTIGYSSKTWDTELYYSRFTTRLGILSDAHIGNVNDLMTRIEYGRPFFDGSFTYTIAAPMQKITHDLVKLKTHIHLKNNGNINATYGFQQNNRQEYDQRRALSGTPTLDLSLTTHTLDVNYEHLTASGWKTIAGVNWINQVNNNTAGTGVTPLIPNFDSYGIGAYGIVRWLSTSWELEAGMRYDYKFLDARGYNRAGTLYGTPHNFNNVSASIGGVKHIEGSWHLRSNVALAWRPPAVNELYSNGLHHGTASYEIGDSTLSSEKSVKWLSSLEKKTKNYSISIDGYINYIADYIYLKPSGEYFQNIRGAFPIYRFKQTNARLLGIDLNGSYNILPFFTYGIKASIVRAKDISNHTYIPWIPADRLQNAIRFNLTDKGFFRDNFIEVRSQLVGRQTRYEPGSDYAEPPAGYHLLGATLASSVKIGKQDILLSLTGDNLTNKLYKDYLNRFRYFAHEIGRNITLRANWKF